MYTPGSLYTVRGVLGEGEQELVGSWLDRVESLANRWAVPLENTPYLSNIKTYWDIYGQAKEVLEHMNNALSLKVMTSYADFMQPLRKSSRKLRKMLWKHADDCDGLQELTHSQKDYSICSIDNNGEYD